MVGRDVELAVCQQGSEEMSAYERLLGDALEGDAALFARQDGVEAAWRVVDPVLRKATPVHPYDPGSWGPKAADAMIAPYGGWDAPVVR
jgi:glucose-6-phosphate 1-dehydrogenase